MLCDELPLWKEKWNGPLWHNELNSCSCGTTWFFFTRNTSPTTHPIAKKCLEWTFFSHRVFLVAFTVYSSTSTPPTFSFKRLTKSSPTPWQRQVAFWVSKSMTWTRWFWASRSRSCSDLWERRWVCVRLKMVVAKKKFNGGVPKSFSKEDFFFLKR